MASMVKAKGVDTSANNGNIDLAKVKKAGYSFVMIRCGYGSDIKSQDDGQFEATVKKAEKLGMPWGVYIYSYATSVAEAKSEVAHVKRLLKSKKPTLPVAFDMEDADSYKSRHGAMKKSLITDICKTFLSEIKKAGYYPMLYTSLSWLGTYIDKSVYSKYDLWVAQWASKCSYTGSNLGMWQYGGEVNVIESNSISGVGTIDKNRCYKDYPTIIKKGGYNNWKKTTPKKAIVKKKVTTTTKKTATITEAELRTKVAKTINGWLGATTGSAGHQEILKIYNAQKPLPVGYKMSTYDAWCAATVSATWLKLGIAKYITTECGCGRFIDNAKKLKIWVEKDSYKPKVGDAVIYYWNDNGVGDCMSGADHIGLVTSVSSNSFVVTEGNTGNGIVAKRTMAVNGRYIRGFITPDYKTIAKKLSGSTKTTQPVKKKPVVTKKSTTVSKPSITIRGVISGKKLDAVKDCSTYTGSKDKALVGLAAKVSKGKIKYKVHIKGGKWLPAVTGYDFANYKNGYAGSGNPVTKGSAIDGVAMVYTTPSDVKKAHGKYKVVYRAHIKGGKWLPWQYNTEKTKGQDGYAGILGQTIDCFEAKLVKA